MPATFTYNDSVNPPFTSTLSDELLASLNSYRLTLVAINPTTGQTAPIYSSVPAAFAGIVNQYFVGPAIQQFPTSTVQTAQTAVTTDNAALQAAITAEIPQFVPGS